MGHSCANGGTCVDGVGNYTCQCPLQYSGKRGRAQGLREAETQCPEAWSYGQKAGALPRCLQELSAGLAAWWDSGGQLLSCFPHLFPRKGL